MHIYDGIKELKTFTKAFIQTISKDYEYGFKTFQVVNIFPIALCRCPCLYIAIFLSVHCNLPLFVFIISSFYVCDACQLTHF